jgi:hypothetical protein
MKPLKQHKNVAVAAVLAFLFGGIGLGIYLRSWRDFAVALAIGLALSSVALKAGPFGFLIVGAALAAYAVARVYRSNGQLARQQTAEPALATV